MESVLCEYLLDALDDLEKDKLKRFKWHLEKHYCIKKTDLEKADAPDTVDLIMRHFGPEEAVKITVDVLRKMNQNHLADKLEKKHNQETNPRTRNDFLKSQAGGSIEGPDPAGASSELMKGEGSQLSTCPDPRALPPSLAGLGLNESEEWKRKRDDEELLRNQDKDFVPKTRKDFLQYSHRITADLNTVNKHLRLSESNTVITNTNPQLQSYPDHPDRFHVFAQVLCRESVSDRRCYWEIEWSRDNVDISVSYKSISRKGGSECVFGRNDQSWSLDCSTSSYSFRHNNIWTVLPVKPIISRTGVNKENHYRVGVYVDHSAGTLSFYSVSGDTMILIHTVQTTFTQPLYPGFRIYGSVKLC